MRTTKNDIIFSKATASFKELGFSNQQCLQLAYCELWKLRGQQHGRTFKCKCDKCPDSLTTPRIEEVISYITSHKNHKTRVITSGAI